MTIEEMIKLLSQQGRYLPNEGLETDEADAIIAALLAGQEMRKASVQKMYIDERRTEICSWQMAKGVEAWDAATQGDKE